MNTKERVLITLALLLTIGHGVWADGMASNKRGDVNGDGSVTVVDVTFLVDYILGNENDGFVIENADVTKDGQITVTDVTALVDIILNNVVPGSDVDLDFDSFDSTDEALSNGTDGLWDDSPDLNENK